MKPCIMLLSPSHSLLQSERPQIPGSLFCVWQMQLIKQAALETGLCWRSFSCLIGAGSHSILQEPETSQHRWAFFEEFICLRSVLNLRFINRFSVMSFYESLDFLELPNVPRRPLISHRKVTQRDVTLKDLGNFLLWNLAVWKEIEIAYITECDEKRYGKKPLSCL